MIRSIDSIDLEVIILDDNLILVHIVAKSKMP